MDSATPAMIKLVPDDPKTLGSRVVAVRYFISRVGAGPKNSSIRLWTNPPAQCKLSDLRSFLKKESIDIGEKFLVECYLDNLEGYMSLEACEAAGVQYDFTESTSLNPRVITLRLTDLSAGMSVASSDGATQIVMPSQNCNTSPLGLFAFALTMGMDSINVTYSIGGSAIKPSWNLTWGPYAFFVSGLLQVIVGMFEVTRNNVYGATAFTAFGGFWLSNGLKLIIVTYFPDQIPDEMLQPDPVGDCLQSLFILGFVCVLFKQTLTLNRLSSILIFFLILSVFGGTFAGFHVAFNWIKCIFSWATAIWAFYVFTAEFTNEVYGREVIKLYPWNERSSDQIFGAAGRTNSLVQDIVKLRSIAPTTDNQLK